MNRWTDEYWNLPNLEFARPPARRGVDWTILGGWIVAIAGPWLIVVATILFLAGRLP